MDVQYLLDTHHLKQQRLQHQLLEHIQFKQVIHYTVLLVVQAVSLNTLLSINGLSQSSVIRPGQTLSVSGNASQATATQVSYQSAGVSTTGNGTYTVKAGDTLYRIAYNHGISLTTLLSINGLSETSTIRPGQQLAVSGSAKQQLQLLKLKQ